MTNGLNLQFSNLRSLYVQGELSPVTVVEQLLSRAPFDDGVWIEPPNAARLMEAARALEARRGDIDRLPLYGLPFAVKDNIDVAGMPTSAACPAYRYMAEKDATVVARLRQAGAMPVGKTNMDQFATGLVGVRTPFGPCRNPFDGEYIAGGSSSGSAVAVAKGMVSFALGTDTAGSGRVPAAFNNLVGLKPSRGRVSNHGTVPACRSLDCVSLFSLTAADAWQALQAASGFDADDPFSRPVMAGRLPLAGPFRFAVPLDEQLDFDGDADAASLFRETVARLEKIGGERIVVDCAPMLEAAALLYEGPWVAERAHALKDFRSDHAGDMDPTVARIIGAADGFSASDAFDAYYRLRELRRRAASIWAQADILVTPTTPTIYTVQAVLDSPIALNSRLGYYTNFVNLMDLSAIAVPSGFRADGLPLGVSLLAPAWEERALCALAARLETVAEPRLGATGYRWTPGDAPFLNQHGRDGVDLAVVGAHLKGQPLHHQLTERQAVFVGGFKTAAAYRLYALADTTPAKPGLVRDAAAGASLEVEVYRLSAEAFGSFVAQVPPPLGIGTVTLADGRDVKGFICEPCALSGAREITRFGGWRGYLDALSAQQTIVEE